MKDNIRECRFVSEESSWGIFFENVSNGRVENCNFEFAFFDLGGSFNCTIVDNTFFEEGRASFEFSSRLPRWRLIWYGQLVLFESQFCSILNNTMLVVLLNSICLKTRF